MPKKKEIDEAFYVNSSPKEEITPVEFADLNTLKDKLNEVIARLNS